MALHVTLMVESFYNEKVFHTQLYFLLPFMSSARLAFIMAGGARDYSSSTSYWATGEMKSRIYFASCTTTISTTK